LFCSTLCACGGGSSRWVVPGSGKQSVHVILFSARAWLSIRCWYPSVPSSQSAHIRVIICFFAAVIKAHAVVTGTLVAFIRQNSALKGFLLAGCALHRPEIPKGSLRRCAEVICIEREFRSTAVLGTVARA